MFNKLKKYAKKYLLVTSMAIVGLTGCAGISEAAGASESLTPKQESIVTVAALTARGDLVNLKGALNAALDNGLTVNEIKEVLVQMYAYSGFPRSLNGLNTFISVLDERRAAGIEDTMGKEASPAAPDRDRYAIGEKTQTALVGQKVAGRVYDFSPEIGVFLKEHLFGDIFERDVLDWQSRELATVGALAGIGNVNPQLAGHMRVSLNIGITPAQLESAAEVLNKNVDKAVGSNAKKVLSQVLGGK